jgi:Ca2+-binding RTX toxin-like protein
MATFQGTAGDDSILRNFLSSGVIADPAASGTETGVSNYIDGGAGNDTIEAGNGDGFGDGDEVHGGAGRDTLTGGGGFDYIYGEGGNDTNWGGEVAGDGDYLDGGSGYEVIKY